MFQVCLAALKWGAPGKSLDSLGSFLNERQGAYSCELGRVHDLWWPWGNIFMGSIINFPCLWLGPSVEKKTRITPHHPMVHLQVPVLPSEAVRPSLLWISLAPWAGDASRLVMPNFSYWTSWRPSPCLLPVWALLQANQIWCHSHNKKWLYVPVQLHPLPPLFPRHLGRLCSQLTRSLC